MKLEKEIEPPKREDEEVHAIVSGIIMTTCRSTEFNAQVAASAIYSVLEDQGVIKRGLKKSNYILNASRKK